MFLYCTCLYFSKIQCFTAVVGDPVRPPERIASNATRYNYTGLEAATDYRCELKAGTRDGVGPPATEEFTTYYRKCPRHMHDELYHKLARVLFVIIYIQNPIAVTNGFRVSILLCINTFSTVER